MMIKKNKSYRPKKLVKKIYTDSADHTPKLITLNSFIAQAGITSRRKAVDLIKKGFITINKRIERNSAYRVKPTDQVAYKGKPIKQEQKVYILLNKPKGYISTVSDEKDRKTVLDLIGLSDIRLYPVGRLDRATSGLLILTNDGDLSVKLAHPKNKIEKVYNVILEQKVTMQDIRTMRNGIRLMDGYIKPDFVDYNDDTGKSIIITLHSGKNRIVRRILESFDYTIKKLDRIQYAQLTKKKLPQGQWRFLTTKEIEMLKNL